VAHHLKEIGNQTNRKSFTKQVRLQNTPRCKETTRGTAKQKKKTPGAEDLTQNRQGWAAVGDRNTVKNKAPVLVTPGRLSNKPTIPGEAKKKPGRGGAYGKEQDLKNGNGRMENSRWGEI